jgi:hypothetical protein
MSRSLKAIDSSPDLVVVQPVRETVDRILASWS